LQELDDLLKILARIVEKCEDNGKNFEDQKRYWEEF